MKRLLSLLLLVSLLVPATDALARWPFRKRVKEQTLTAETEKREDEAKERGPFARFERKNRDRDTSTHEQEIPRKEIKIGPPVQQTLKKANGRVRDVRLLPKRKPAQKERPEHEGPEPAPIVAGEGLTPSVVGNAPNFQPAVTAAAPAPIIDFEGLDRLNWGAGSPPDTTGDVGPTYYIQAVNTSVGIYRKSDGFQEAAFTFDTLMSQGNFGNLCDTDNFGDPVVLYDTFEDRWVLTDFAFVLDGGGNVNPPIAYQCFAVSQTGNPLTGGWNFYSIPVTDGLHDYEKLAVWTDGIYMSANMFGYASGASFFGARAWAINKQQMYAGAPTVQIISFDIGAGDFTVVPSNARVQTGTPPAGRPNMYISTWNFLNAVSVYQFHVDWATPALSTFTGPSVPLAATSWPNASVANAPQSGTATLLDVLQLRAMVQNQYTNFSGVESLWVPHTVRRANTTGFAAPRWYQVDVSGGTVAPNIPQAATWDPDAANVMHRFMPSLAIDRTGNMALAYSTSSSTTFPSIKYAGRLASDPVNTFSQTEQTLFTGTASQTTSTRWGDYSSVMLDPDGCTFWITNQYANPLSQASNERWRTRIGAFRYPECTMVGAGGTLSGTVTVTPGGTPISGVTINFGARTTTTDGSGDYSFTGIPAGTYPSITASKPGYVSSSATNIVITDGGTTDQDFALALAPVSACPTDTTQADFQAGAGTNVDVNTTPGSLTLLDAPVNNQQNTTLGTSGVGITVTTWGGQTFTPSVTGQLVRADINLFCSGCTGTIPNLTLSLRATSAGLPTGADLATGTITGFNSGASGYYTVTFGAPATINAGTQYALVVRPTANPSPGTYALTRSGTSTVGADVYAGGTRVAGATSGTVWSIPLTGGVSTDAGFRIFIQTGFAASGNFVSSLKDANPLAGLTPVWDTITWNTTVPASTTVTFQVAGSNSPYGPFNFVGPDGTAGTFYTTSGGSLSQFYGQRYLKYKAYLTSSNPAATPAIQDVTLCFDDLDCSAAITVVPTESAVCGGSTGNTATGPAGAASYSWGITNGTITSATNTQSVTYTAGASGNVVLTLNIVETGGCEKSDDATIPINAIPATPAITPGGPTTFCAGGSVTLTSDSASGNQWYLDGNPIGGETNQSYIATASGSYTVVVTLSGCSSSPSSATVVTVNPSPATPTITPGGPTTFCTGGSVTLTSSSPTGNQWYLDGNPIGGETNQAYIATASGSYTVVVTASGCSSAPSTATVVTVNAVPSTPTITPGGPTTFCAGNSVTLASSSATGNQWYLDGNPIGGATNQNYVATLGGSYTVIVTNGGCSSSPSSATVVTVNPAPATPTITPSGPTTFCTGGSVTLTSSSASGNQWYLNGNPIGGETNQSYIATASGSYTVIVTASGCPSAPSAATVVTVNPVPSTPTITPGGSTTFCAGGSVTLTSSSASGNQWYLDGNPIGGATNQSYVASASGSYTVVVTASGCPSATSTATVVTVNPVPSTPTITPSGPTAFCAGGSVTLTSSSATGNQWRLNGNPIGGATNQTYVASVAGDYTVVVTASGCSSAPSATTTVTVNPNPNATITAPASVATGSTGNVASVANAGVGASYSWSITGGTITAGTGTSSITFTAGAVGMLTLNVTVTTGAGCSDAKSANVTVSAPTVTVTNVNPNSGSTLGNKSVTITGTGFLTGATVTFGGSSATNVSVVNSTHITAKTPAHAAGAVNVVVTNTNASTGTLNNGYTYVQQNFDPNGDSMIDPSDIFYLIAYLFTGGPAPAGVAGMPSGDANGDGNVDPADIFYVVNYLFSGGAEPHARNTSPAATTAAAEPLSGALRLGNAVQRDGRFFVPVLLTMDAGSRAPRALSVRVRFNDTVTDAAMRRGAAVGQPVFEVSRRTDDAIAYLVAFSDAEPLALDANRSAVIAEIEVSAPGAVRLDIDPQLTMLVGSSDQTATVGRKNLRVSGTAIGRVAPPTLSRDDQ
ncbi:MAG TPA: carboxypeptidase regulatory-like domain-containing protein [Thermoanaerobaculia bacterium]|nr:carboxypeptidase regulatory-like domain-containing protein [Thermoanaerobaculia bacterium]